MFHRVLPEGLIKEPDAYCSFGTLVSLEFFELILAILKKNDFEFVNVSEIGAKKYKKRTIALTFDDGYSDNFEFAYPSLKKFDATATFFPVVSPCKENSVLPLDTYYQYVDEANFSADERKEFISGRTKRNFYWSEPNEQLKMLKELFKEPSSNSRVKYMTEEQLKQLSNEGFEIGSHGITHSLLIADYMTEDRAIAELSDSKRWLEEILEKPILSYCFPAGRYNTRMIELAKQIGYTSTCLVHKNKNERHPLVSHERFFVKPDSLESLKVALKIE